MSHVVGECAITDIAGLPVPRRKPEVRDPGRTCAYDRDGEHALAEAVIPRPRVPSSDRPVRATRGPRSRPASRRWEYADRTTRFSVRWHALDARMPGHLGGGRASDVLSSPGTVGAIHDPRFIPIRGSRRGRGGG